MRSSAGLHADTWHGIRVLRASRCTAIILLLAGNSLIAQDVAPEQRGVNLRCGQPAAEFIDVQGVVEYRPASGLDWRKAAPGDWLCIGDTVRVSPYGQTRVRLLDDTLLSLDRNTSATFGTPGASVERGTLVNLLRGLIHVISRDPRSLRFDTPYVNAGLEGTEFTIEVGEESTEIAVIEGTVAMSNDYGAIALDSGLRAVARARAAPTPAGAARATDVLAWTAHIPEIFATTDSAADATPTAAQAQSAAFYAGRADARLRLGLVELAEQDIADSLRLQSGHASALALRALVELAESNRAAARESIEQALAGTPGDVPALLAASYVRQADDAAGARIAVDTAAALEPDNRLVATRLAELLVADGDADAGLAAAEQALALEPGSSRAHVVRGFAYLLQSRSSQALDAFSSAVMLDPRLPLARVGLAVARARARDLAAARRELETAVALDPRNAVLRSYVAKAYAAQNRADLSDTQLELARNFDPLDQTPWLYGAIHHQQLNEPVQALWELERSADEAGQLQLRSSLTLDEDLAARSAGIGRLYRSLGFNRLAMQRGIDLVQAAPDDDAGYQLLADVYSTEPRHQMARVNAQYTAQLLRPINLSPVQPQAAETNLFLIDQLGPSDLASSDLGMPFTRNGLRVQASGIRAANDTQGVEFAVAGVNDRISYSAGYFDYETDGFRTNNDFAQGVASALVQYRATEDTSWLFELRSTEIDRGDIALKFAHDNFSPFQRFDESRDVVRIGVRHETSTVATWLALVSTFESEGGLTASPFSRLDAATKGYSTDLQRIFVADQWQFISGLRHYDADRIDVSRITDAPIPFPPFVFSSVETTAFEQKHSVLYGYGVRHIGPKIDLTLGLEAAQLATDQTDMRSTLPRLGMAWRPTPHTKVRASIGEHLQGPFTSKFSIDPTIAPMAVAGFNHQYFGGEGEHSMLKALALDHEFSDRLYAGLETVERNLDIPTTVFEPTTNATRVVNADRQETMTRGYVYWTPTSEIGFAAEYLDDEFDNAGNPLFDSYALLDTQRLPITLSFFHGPRLSTRLRSTYVEQSGLFSDIQLTAAGVPETELYSANERFWVADLEIGYRLVNRRGMLSLIVANLFDQTFRFQDADPENPRIMPERVASLRFTLAH